MEQNNVIIKQKKDLEYYMQISEIDKKQKELIHNITNQIKMIYVFAKDGNTKAILELTDSIGAEMEKDSRMVYCDNPVLNSLLNEKRREAGNSHSLLCRTRSFITTCGTDGFDFHAWQSFG